LIDTGAGLSDQRRCSRNAQPRKITAAQNWNIFHKTSKGFQMTKNKMAYTSTAALILAANFAQAAPIQLIFSGNYAYETAGAAAIYGSTDALSGSVVYDADKPFTTSVLLVGFNSSFGMFSDAFTSLNINVSGNLVSSSKGFAFLGNDVTQAGSPPMDIFLSYSGNQIPGIIFSGYTKDGWTLQQANFAFNPLNSTANDSNVLPAASSLIADPFRVINLSFVDSANQAKAVTFTLTDVHIAPIPLPSSMALFGSGVLGMLFQRRVRHRTRR